MPWLSRKYGRVGEGAGPAVIWGIRGGCEVGVICYVKSARLGRDIIWAFILLVDKFD